MAFPPTSSSSPLPQRLLDDRSILFLLLFSLPLLFLPKINLLTVKNQTAGLRIDDLILLGFSFICFWANFSMRHRLLEIEVAILAITGFSLFSYGVNQLLFAAKMLNVSASFFYCFRLLEYFLFFYAGIFATRFFRIETLLKWFFVWNLVLMILQKLQIIGIFAVEGYIAKPDDRMLGVASFGSEIGLLLNLLFCFFLYQNSENVKERYLRLPPDCRRLVQALYPYVLLLLFIFLVVLSGARMAIFALFVCFLFYLKKRVTWRNPLTFILPLLFLVMGTGLLIFALYNASGIVERSKGLLSFANFDLITPVWDNISLEYDPIGKETVTQGLQDTSWWMRIHKWCYASKLYWLNPICWLQGVGPGFAMAALDGGFLRLFTELGLIGFLLYGRLFYVIARQSPQLYWMMVAFLLNMIFFDVYLAYKPMSLLFLVAGYQNTRN